jgi:hypothetical protein
MGRREGSQGYNKLKAALRRVLMCNVSRAVAGHLVLFGRHSGPAHDAAKRDRGFSLTDGDKESELWRSRLQYCSRCMKVRCRLAKTEGVFVSGQKVGT